MSPGCGLFGVGLLRLHSRPQSTTGWGGCRWAACGRVVVCTFHILRLLSSHYTLLSLNFLALPIMIRKFTQLRSGAVPQYTYYSTHPFLGVEARYHVICPGARDIPYLTCRALRSLAYPQAILVTTARIQLGFHIRVHIFSFSRITLKWNPLTGITL